LGPLVPLQVKLADRDLGSPKPSSSLANAMTRCNRVTVSPWPRSQPRYLTEPAPANLTPDLKLNHLPLASLCASAYR